MVIIVNMQESFLAVLTILEYTGTSWYMIGSWFAIAWAYEE